MLKKLGIILLLCSLGYAKAETNDEKKIESLKQSLLFEQYLAKHDIFKDLDERLENSKEYNEAEPFKKGEIALKQYHGLLISYKRYYHALSFAFYTIGTAIFSYVAYSKIKSALGDMNYKEYYEGFFYTSHPKVSYPGPFGRDYNDGVQIHELESQEGGLSTGEKYNGVEFIANKNRVEIKNQLEKNFISEWDEAEKKYNRNRSLSYMHKEHLDSYMTIKKENRYGTYSEYFNFNDPYSKQKWLNEKIFLDQGKRLDPIFYTLNALSYLNKGNLDQNGNPIPSFLQRMRLTLRSAFSSIMQDQTNFFNALMGTGSLVATYFLGKNMIKIGKEFLDPRVPIINSAELVDAYVRKRNLLTSTTQSYCEKDLLYRFWQDPDLATEKRIKETLSLALRLPLLQNNLEFNRDALLAKLGHYDEELVNKLVSFYFSEVVNRRIESAGGLKKTRFPAYFIGEPGVGKTYAAAQIARVAKSRLISISLDNAEAEDILGNPEKPGRILEAMAAGATSIHDFNDASIVFFDEFDKVESKNEVVGVLLKILDPDFRGFYSHYLRSWIKLPPTIIIAGNQAIVNQALANRFDYINFTGYSVEAKKQIVRETILPELAKVYSLIEDEEYKIDLISGKERETILHAIDRFIAADNDPGMRSSLRFLLREIDETILQRIRK